MRSAAGALVALYDTVTIPVEYPEDGAAPPSAPVLTSSGTYCRVRTRDFSNAATQEIIVNWSVPDDIIVSHGVKFRVKGYITAAVAPAAGEGINFKGGGYCIITGNAGDGALGALAEAEIADLNAVGCATRYDIFDTDYSGVMTITNLVAKGHAVISIIRDQADAVDDYGQLIGFSEVVLQFARLFRIA